jgi:hypothetical protein
MTAISLTVSLAIAGWGDPTTGLPYRLRAKSRSTVGGTVVPAAILESWPDSVGDQVGFGDLSKTVASMGFAVGGLHSAAGLSLLRFLYQAAPPPWGALITDVTKVATSIHVARILGEVLPVAPCVLYLEREVLLCSNIALHYSGTYYVCTVTRGAFGSSASTHSSRELADRYIYDRNPIADSREVVLYDLDVDDDTETVVWTGLLEQPNRAGGTVQLSALAELGMLQGVRLGRDRAVWAAADVSREYPLNVSVDTNHCRARMRSSLAPDGRYVVASDGEAVYRGMLHPALDSGSPGALLKFAEGDLDPAFESFGTKRKLGRVTLRECLIAGDAGHPYEDWCAVRNDTGQLSCHPLDIAACILESSGTATWDNGDGHQVGDAGVWDWLGKCWGIGLTSFRMDWAGIRTLRGLGIYRDLRCPSFIIGAAAESPTLAEVLQRLLAPLLCFTAMTADGKVTIKSLLDYRGAADLVITDASLAGPAQADPQPFSIGELYSSVALKLGRVGLGEATKTVFDTGGEDTESNRYPLGRDVAELDCGDYGDPETGVVPERQEVALQRLNRLRYLLLTSRLPVYVVRLRGIYARLPSGSTLDVTLTNVVGPDGEWGIANHRCVVIGSELATETRVQTLRLLDLYPLQRASTVVCPSWRVKGATDYTELEVEADEFSADDVANWVNDAHYDLWSSAGVLLSDDPRTGMAAGGTDIVMDESWYSGGLKLMPAAGMVIRLASYDVVKSYGEWPDATYIADVNAELGTAEDPAHRWGW